MKLLPTIQSLRTALRITTIAEMQIALILASRPNGIETQELIGMANCASSSAFKYLKRMQAFGFVIQEGRQPNAFRWVLTPLGQSTIAGAFNKLPRPASVESGENPPPVSHQPDGVVTTGGATI